MYARKSFNYPLIQQLKNHHFDNQLPQRDSPKKPIPNTFKLPAQKFHLNVDYDLPLKQLQYTQTRKYKQNLNPIFQLLSTNNYRYKQTTELIPQRLNNSDHSLSNIYSGKNQKQQYFQFSKENKVKNQRNKRVLSFNNGIFPSAQQKIVSEIQSLKTMKFIDQKVKRKQKREKKNDFLDDKKDNQQKILSSQMAQQFLINTENKINNYLSEIEENKEKLSILRSKLQMVKEKNILKERQIYLSDEQRERESIKFKCIEKCLLRNSQETKKSESQHHKVFKMLKMKKKELTKQQKWLQEQNVEVQKMKKKMQILLMKMRGLNTEQEKREELAKQIIEQVEFNKQLRGQLQEANSHIMGLQQQLQIIDEQTQTLQSHQNQLSNLQLKFKLQTQKLKQHHLNLNSQLQAKINTISQESQLQSTLKKLELQIGQMHQQKIILAQNIKQTHHKISLKNNNIKHIQNLHSKKYQTLIPQSNQSKPANHISQSFSYKIPQNTQINTKNTQFTQNNQALPTIRQQSKNTSLYQTPKNQQLFVTQSQQQSHHPFSSNSLQINSNSQTLSRTQILKPYQVKNQKQRKKYFVIESEDDASSNTKSVYGLRKTEMILINKDAKASIEQRIQVQDEKKKHMRTQNEETYRQQQNFKSLNLRSINQLSPLEKKNKLKQTARDRQKQKSKKIEQQVDDDSEEAFQNLIQRFQHIKSNSYFEQNWKQKS